MGICRENCLVIVELGVVLDDRVPVFWVGDLEVVGHERKLLKVSNWKYIH